jgi:AraC-like DNA-binding protein
MYEYPNAKRGVTAVTTILTPAERNPVDLAGEGVYNTVHRDSVDEAIRDLQERHIDAVLVSVARCSATEISRVATMVREFPRVPMVALLTKLEAESARAVLILGRSGVRTLIDAREPSGWRQLRDTLLSDRTSDITRLALGQLSTDLRGVPDDCWRFFEILFTDQPPLYSVRQLSHQFKIVPSTLMSRFFRARLPAPKRFIAMARLIRAAYLFENPGLSVANVANHLEYSSPQSFGRHIRGLLHTTAVDFRHQYDGEGMFRRFRSELVLPNVATLRNFYPFTPLSGSQHNARPTRTRPPQRGARRPSGSTLETSTKKT